MAKTPRPPKAQPAAVATDPAATDQPLPETASAASTEDSPAPANVPVRWLEMRVGLSGVGFSLSPGDKHPFRDVPGADGEPSEAQRLVDAGYGDFCDQPKA